MQFNCSGRSLARSKLETRTSGLAFAFAPREGGRGGRVPPGLEIPGEMDIWIYGYTEYMDARQDGTRKKMKIGVVLKRARERDTCKRKRRDMCEKSKERKKE